MDSSPLPVDSSFAGAYRIVRVLVEEEGSTVYAAEALSTGALRALEVLQPPAPFGSSESATFLKETARATLLFESAHVPLVVDAGVEAGAPWQATELLEGETLDAALARDGALGIRAGVALLGQVAEALGAAHAAGVVHGHLTSARIFLLTPGRGASEPQIKVLGFGTARLVESWVARVPLSTGPVAPRFLWMSPAQVRGKGGFEPATDLWAFGLLAFLVLTGHHYWNGASLLELLPGVLNEPLVPARQRANDLGVFGRLPPGFDGWFARCLARDPMDRFRGAQEAMAELEILFDGPRTGAPTFAVETSEPRDEGLADDHPESPGPDAGDSGGGPYRKGARAHRIEASRTPSWMRDHRISSARDSLLEEGHRPRSPSRRRLVAAAVVTLMLLAALWLFVLRS